MVRQSETETWNFQARGWKKALKTRMIQNAAAALLFFNASISSMIAGFVLSTTNHNSTFSMFVWGWLSPERRAPVAPPDAEPTKHQHNDTWFARQWHPSKLTCVSSPACCKRHRQVNIASASQHVKQSKQLKKKETPQQPSKHASMNLINLCLHVRQEHSALLGRARWPEAPQLCGKTTMSKIAHNQCRTTPINSSSAHTKSLKEASGHQ